MEKEKNKAKPRRHRTILAVLTVILVLIVSLYGAFSYYYLPGHSISEFSRFESEEDVVAFLHDNFDLGVTTSAEIQTFLSVYLFEDDACQYSNPTRASFAGGIIVESVARIMYCRVPYWSSGNVEIGYYLRFDIDRDDRLIYIEAYEYCDPACTYP